MMLFNAFINKYKIKNESTSKLKIYHVLSVLFLIDIGICLRGGPFETDLGVVNLHAFRGTHLLLYIHECYFDSYGCAPPQKLSRLFIKRNVHCLFFEYKKQSPTSKRDSYCASYCLYVIYSKKVLGTDFKSAILKLYYQTI